jgi:hypothetical protein
MWQAVHAAAAAPTSSPSHSTQAKVAGGVRHITNFAGPGGLPGLVDQRFAAGQTASMPNGDVSGTGLAVGVGQSAVEGQSCFDDHALTE